MEYLRYRLKAWLRKAGREICHFPIMSFLSQYDINLVLDVGANIGQYAKELRYLGYKGRIVSFEPLSSAYKALAKNAARDTHWITENFALGNQEQQLEIHISKNSASSSLMEMLPELPILDPRISYISKETVSVKRMASVFKHYCSPEDRIFLKVDTQGYEKKVLEGALEVLPRIIALELEMSIVPIYDGELLIEDQIAYLRQHGFTPIWFTNGYRHPISNHLLQVDGIFVNNNRVDPCH